jgi:hypothetical protein
MLLLRFLEILCTALFGSETLTLICIVDALHRHHHPRRHSGRHLRARGRGESRFDPSFVMDLIAGTGLLTLPAMGNFLQIGL